MLPGLVLRLEDAPTRITIRFGDSDGRFVVLSADAGPIQPGEVPVAYLTSGPVSSRREWTSRDLAGFSGRYRGADPAGISDQGKVEIPMAKALAGSLMNDRCIGLSKSVPGGGNPAYGCYTYECDRATMKVRQLAPESSIFLCIARKTIEAGGELHWSYGPGYWTSNDEDIQGGLAATIPDDSTRRRFRESLAKLR